VTTTVRHFFALCGLVSVLGCGSSERARNVTLTISLRADGGGTGTVTTDAAGLSCANGTCSAPVASGTTVTLTATPGSARFVRWEGACSGTASICQLPVHADSDVRAVFLGANYVFVTSSDVTPVGLTLVSADSECALRARAAGLPGTYVAWLSTSTVSALSRLGGARGWVRTDGLPFTDSAAWLTQQNAVLYPPRLDEWGQVPARSEVITGTDPNGQASSYSSFMHNCDDWSNPDGTLMLGDASGGSKAWTAVAGTVCTSAVRAHLYCFGVDAEQALPALHPQGRIAFLSGPVLLSSPGAPSGVALFDAQCASQASAAGLSGTFKALVATSTSAAVARFDLNGPTWVRPDGVAVVSAAADLASHDLLAPIDVGPGGWSYGWYSSVWTGSKSPGAPGTADMTCADWTTTSSTSSGGIGNAMMTAGPPSTYKTATGFFYDETTSGCAGGAFACPVTVACSSMASVYCLEQ
jgi:List-Bact-rpt repeat protein